VSQVVGVWIKFCMRQNDRAVYRFSEQYQANVTLFSASSGGNCAPPRNACSCSRWVVRGSRLINVSSTNPGWHITAHHRADHRETVASARPKSGSREKIIGTGKRRIERDTGSRGAPAKLRAQDIEHQRLGRASRCASGWRRPP